MKNTSADSRQTVSHGDYPDWLDALSSLPDITPTSVSLDEDEIRIGLPEDCSAPQREAIRRQLKRLLPWRKGPFNLFGLEIDAEWRSDMKWRRLQDKITPLTGRAVLDVGCGNGYYGWRMLGAGAERVVGLDPTLRYVMQQRAVAKYLPDVPFDILPFTLEALAADKAGLQLSAKEVGIQLQHNEADPQLTAAEAGATPAEAGSHLMASYSPLLKASSGLKHVRAGFDTVFSMGVIYHRRDPVNHIRDLLSFLRPGGELVLESLIIDEKYGTVLEPRGRYAKMRNIWSIPSINTMKGWLSAAGLSVIEVADVSVTTPAEQRVTEWTFEQSLADFLDPQNPSLTIEGHPAPKRAILICSR